MSLSVDLPPQVEEAYRAEAHAKGMQPSDLIREVLIARQPSGTPPKGLFEEGLGMFGSLEDSALLDEVVAMAYEERKRPTRLSSVL